MNIHYPYIPEGRSIRYVPLDNPFIKAAKEFARTNSLDKTMPTGAVLVKEAKIIGFGANGSAYHQTHECERVKLKIPTGQGYELCEGCHPKNHAEPKAIQDAKAKGNDLQGADLYLWGHWWCCEPCWKAMIDGGVRDVYLADDSWELFDRTNSKNIVGKQFA